MQFLRRLTLLRVGRTQSRTQKSKAIKPKRYTPKSDTHRAQHIFRNLPGGAQSPFAARPCIAAVARLRGTTDWLSSVDAHNAPGRARQQRRHLSHVPQERQASHPSVAWLAASYRCKVASCDTRVGVKDFNATIDTPNSQNCRPYGWAVRLSTLGFPRLPECVEINSGRDLLVQAKNVHAPHLPRLTKRDWRRQGTPPLDLPCLADPCL